MNRQTKLFIILINTIFFLMYLGQPSYAQDLKDELSSYVQQFYYQVDQVDWDKVELAEDLLDQLDTYSAYLSKEEYDRLVNSLDPKLVGIGVEVQEVEEGFLIVRVIEDGPAMRSGILAGDMITHVNGESYVGKPLESVVTVIRGDQGTSVNITVVRNGQNKEFTIERAPIILSTISSKRLGGDIGYIQISSFGETTASDMHKAIQNLPNVNGWILDLRNNGGGYLRTSQQVLGFFPQVKIAANIARQKGSPSLLLPLKQSITLSEPTHLLVNGYSASASEVVAAAMKDSEAATLYGQNTFGKGSIQNLLSLSNGGVFRLTTSHYYSPNFSAIHEVGVAPNVETKPSEELKQAHGDILDKQFSTYERFEEPIGVQEKKEFTVTFSDPIDWDEQDISAVEFIEVGGESMAVEIEQIADTKMVVRPVEKLQSAKSYRLYIHPRLVSTEGTSLKKGVYTEIVINE